MCPVCGNPLGLGKATGSGGRRKLKTCGRKSCAYELKARSTRGNEYGDRGGGPRRTTTVSYSAVHARARRDLRDVEECSLADDTCNGRLEVALKRDLPPEQLATSCERHGFSLYYTGVDSGAGYRKLCRSHHAREGSLIRAWALVSSALEGRDVVSVDELRSELLVAFFGEDIV